MTDKRTAVCGIYSNRIQTEGVVDALIQAGFSATDISLLLPEDEPAPAAARPRHTRASGAAATGVAASGVILGAIAMLAGVGSLAVPGFGPLIAAGPIVATLAGSGTTAGGLLATLVGMGIPEYDARRYEGRVKRGGILVSVHGDSPEEIRRAHTVLETTGAEDIAYATEPSGTEAAAVMAGPSSRP
jgi:hypothetical protein